MGIYKEDIELLRRLLAKVETLLLLLRRRRRKLPKHVNIVFSDGRRNVEEELQKVRDEIRALLAYLQLKEEGFNVQIAGNDLVVVDEEFEHIMVEIEKIRRTIEGIRKKGAREA